MIKIGLLGLGTVGSGVFEIIDKMSTQFGGLTGSKVEIVKILVKNGEKERVVNKGLVTTDPYEILNDEGIDIVVEVMGGTGDAYTYIRHALDKGKHVVTANKAVVEKHMGELLELSRQRGAAFLFEASVGGGIPILKPLKQHVGINSISEIKGILNGTTNFILTKMSDEGLSFGGALELAQKSGYAEADPTDDVEGYDVRRKLAILSSIAFRDEIKGEDIYCRGISSISPRDVEVIHGLGYSVKLLGKAIVRGEEFSAAVEPVLVGEGSSFGVVKDAFNLVSMTGDTVGELQFYGQGAGKNPTANAVVCDIIDVITGAYKTSSIAQDKSFKRRGEGLIEGRYYLRVKPKPSKALEVPVILKKHGLEYEVMGSGEDIVMLTGRISAEKMNRTASQLNSLAEGCFYARFE